MTPEEMAQIHHAAFTQERGWAANEFKDLLQQRFIQVFSTQGGFALTRSLAGESELLTLAVAPHHQRRGIAKALLTDWIAATSAHADTAFLEVAADNHAAIALYKTFSFQSAGIRKAYYKRASGPAVDAVLMTRALTLG
ncbi:GNAT family N-acetyltransferase [Sulfitobacter donghicola]|uniref:Alanine acetyltransferase n=1 Tax=Sulfitobacter donghicola DSW-25 = KCTC 12864 = JCM 14565 TaxID=1300350 RepID=A0A073IJ20_9RHOB|nr:N-acetyltransferase [Sulfitobacter donghicola]KEJ89769.1 alanine acetyltransferase [Sulfitobacter donghicola DSW-25 = KCTC 12864 = JCM 14565]KIN67125.1 Ribosomal-protein-alanine acetyltransferase [Sulfitobacter donghicola DSW-25 = KCTC 12864 = JCM 14565]